MYDRTVAFVKKEKADMADKMTKNIGFAMGIEFREGSLLIGPKTTARARKGNLTWLGVHKLLIWSIPHVR